MKITSSALAIGLFALSAQLSTAALAHTGTERFVAPIAAQAALPFAPHNGEARKIARHGADDPAGDDRGGKGRGKDDGANHASNGSDDVLFQTARHGADDPAGDDRGGKGRGKDDGANHA